MAGITSRSFDTPDETRSPDKTQVDVLHLGPTSAARFTMQPGWKWSECVKPVAGTDVCQTHHMGAVVSGVLHVVHDDGTEEDLRPGNAYIVEPGHDAWVVGDEPFVGFEFDSKAAETYAVKS